MTRPETRFAWNGDVSLAYQVVGDGKTDLIYLQGYCSNVDMNWESPYLSRFLRGLARYARLVISDRRGWGCSERFTPGFVSDIDALTDDLLTVMRAAGCDQASILATYDAAAVEEVGRFLAAVREEEASLDRVLATVLFTDIVGSTERAAELGDRRWRELVERHHATVRALLARFRGKEVDTAGDGFFASFDGPARGVRCALAIVQAVQALGLQVRAGIHTGEVETIGGKIGGLAVNIGARVAAKAAPSEVLVSQTVRDLVAGSGLAFEDRGAHTLKGVPGEWRVYATRVEVADPVQRG